MEQRVVERLGRTVSVVGLGTWQLGADWGTVDADAAHSVLESAVEHGVTFFDTADVYGDGRSERFCADLYRRDRDVLIATKMGRRVEQVAENYTRDNFLAWNDRSRANLGVEQIDLVPLHCPPDAVYESDAVFEALDEMVEAGRIRAYGASVETCVQALRRSLGHTSRLCRSFSTACGSNRSSRSSPPLAPPASGSIARVPLASGLLSGRYDESTVFPAGDHRKYNRHGESRCR